MSVFNEIPEFIRGRPFWEETLSWEDKYPDISTFLRSWTSEEVENLNDVLIFIQNHHLFWWIYLRMLGV